MKSLVRSRTLTILFFIVLADMIGFGLVIPLLPYYAKQFHASDFIIGLLSMVYPLGQVFAAPLIGRLSDKFGRKIALILSVGGTFFSLLLLGFAKSLVLIFTSRLVDGLTGGNITVAQSYISDFTDEKSRSKGLGIIGAAFGLGFILGPALGGFLSRWGLSVPAFFAAGLSFVNLMNIIFLLPDSKPSLNPKQVPYTFEELKKTFSQKTVLNLLLTKFFYSLGFTMFESSFALFSMRRFNLAISQTSFILTYLGIVIVTVQGFLVGKISKKFTEYKLVKFLFPISTVLLSIYSFSRNIPTLLIILTPLSISSALVGVSLTSLSTKVVSKDRLGGTLGIFNSVDSLTRIFSPLFGAIVIQFFGPNYLGIVIGTFLAIGYLVFSFKFSSNFVKSKEIVPESN